MFDNMNIDVWDVSRPQRRNHLDSCPFIRTRDRWGLHSCHSLLLSWQAEVTGGPSTMIEQAKHIDESMPNYVVNKIIFGLNKRKKRYAMQKNLILGITYKENVNDIRESPFLKLLMFLIEMNAEISYHDPLFLKLAIFQGYQKLNCKAIELDRSIESIRCGRYLGQSQLLQLEKKLPIAS